MSRARTFADLATASEAGSLASPNMIINGDMAVAQRATSASGIGASTGYHTVDRFVTEFTTSGRMTQSQAAITDLPGFKYALKCDCTTADTSVDAAEYTLINQRMEGYTVSGLASGTSSAKKSTVSFYVKGNASATYVVELIKAGDRHINKTFSVTTSWSRVSITFDGDTTTQLAQDNTQELSVNIWIHAGSNYTSGSLQTSWGAYTAANRAVGISSFFDSTNRELFITGMQYELGEVATPFKHETFGDNLARCQRYYHKIDATVAYTRYAVGQAESTTQAEVYYEHPVEMRAKPTLGQTGTASNYAVYQNAGVIALSTVPVINSAQTKKMGVINPTVSSGMTQGEALIFLSNNNTDSYIEYIAEL
jgi:hypothetical protein